MSANKTICICLNFLDKAWLLIDYLEYSDDWPYLYCYNLNVSIDMSIGLLQVFLVELGSPHRISNQTPHPNHSGRPFQLYQSRPGTSAKLQQAFPCCRN